MECIGEVDTAHALLKEVYRNPAIPLAVRLRAAMSAIPYEAPKLAVTAIVSEGDFATLLDRRLARMQAIERQGNGKTEVAEPPVTEVAPQSTEEVSEVNGKPAALPKTDRGYQSGEVIQRYKETLRALRASEGGAFDQANKKAGTID